MANIPKFIVKRPGDVIQQIGGQVQSLIGNISQIKQQDDERKKKDAALERAAEMARQDWGQMEAAYKGIKQTYLNSADKAIANELLTPEEKETFLNFLSMPTQEDKKDVKGYLKRLQDVWAKYDATLKQRETEQETKQRQQDVGQFVKQQIAGREAVPPQMQGVGPEQEVPTPQVGGGFTEQDIEQTPGQPAVEPAQTQQDVQRAAQGQFTQEEIESQPGFQALPSERDIEDAKLELQKAKIALTNARKSKVQSTTRLAEKKVQIAEDRAKATFNKGIATLIKESNKINQQIKQASQPDPITQEVDEDAVTELETQKLNIQDQIEKLKAEKKFVGQIPGETRKFTGKGVEESVREFTTAQKTPSQIPPPQTPQKKTKREEIIEVLKSRNWDNKKIDAFLISRGFEGLQ